MALLTDGAAALVTFASPVSSAWKALSPIPGTGLNGALTDAVSNGTSLAIYVVSASAGMFAYPGGLATGYDDTIVSVATGGTTLAVDTGGVDVTYVKVGTAVWVYGSSGVLELVDASDATALKAFLP